MRTTSLSLLVANANYQRSKINIQSEPSFELQDIVSCEWIQECQSCSSRAKDNITKLVIPTIRRHFDGFAIDKIFTLFRVSVLHKTTSAFAVM